MGTFNAGAIEANLTLGRSDWKKDLELTKREIRDLENTTVTIGIDADSDNAQVSISNIELFLEDLDSKTYTPSIDVDIEKANATLDVLEARLDELGARTVTIGADADTDNAMIQLSLLEDQMDLLESDPVNIQADADIAAAVANLSALSAAAEAVSAETVNIDVDVDDVITALEQMLALEAAIIAVDSNDIDIDVDYDQAAMESLVGSAAGMGGGGGHLGLLRILLVLVIGLLPILAVASGAALAAVVAFGAAIAGAVGPVVALAGGLALLISEFKNTDPSDYTPGMQALADALNNMQDALDALIPLIQESGFGLMADAIQLVADVLPTLAPLFNATADMMGGVLGGIRDFVNSPEYGEMLAFFGDFGVDMLETFLRIGGNLLRFFGRLFQAIEPFAREMMQGLEDLTAGWAEWADDLENNESFQHFLENAAEYGPQVLDMLGSMLDAFMAVGHALEPFAGPALDALIGFFDFIANMDPTVLGWLVVGLGAIYVATAVLIPIVTGLVGAIEGIVAVVGLVSLPVLAVVAALVALGVILYLVWTRSEKFRESVKDTWNDIWATIAPIVRDIVQVIKDNWGPIKEWAAEVWGSIQSIIEDYMEIIQVQVGRVLSVIRVIWSRWGEQIMGIARGVVTIVGGLIRGFFKILQGIFQLISGVLTGNWGKAWEGIKNIARGGAIVVTGMIRGMAGILGNALQIVGGALKSVWTGVWNWITSKVRSAVDSIANIVSGLIGRVTGPLNTVRDAVNGLVGKWNSLSMHVDIPDEIPGLPDEWTVSTPDVPYLARGGIAYDPTLAVVGDNPGPDPEVIQPLSNLKSLLGNSAGNLDYDRLAAAVSAALETALSRMSGLLSGGITREDLERLIEAAGIKVDIDARGADPSGLLALPGALTFELRRLGYGGKASV